MEVFLMIAPFACAATFSPGPNNVLLLSSTGRYGFWKNVRLLLGIWTGLLTVMLLCAFLCGMLGAVVPKAAPYVKYLGAAYILYLAYKTLTRKTVDSKDASEQPLTYVNGFLLQFLNVKILMLGITAYTSYMYPSGRGGIADNIAFTLTMAGCAAAGNLIWAGAGTALCPLYNRFYRWFNLALCLLFLWCVWRILFM